MNAAETSASSAIADWTPLTVVSRSLTTAEIETFMIDVSTTSTNIAAARSTERRVLPEPGTATAPGPSEVMGATVSGRADCPPATGSACTGTPS